MRMLKFKSGKWIDLDHTENDWQSWNENKSWQAQEGPSRGNRPSSPMPLLRRGRGGEERPGPRLALLWQGVLDLDQEPRLEKSYR